MTDRILDMLLRGGTVSGEAMAQRLNVTRAAVFKQISQLRELGFQIESEPGQGYRLAACPDSLMAPVVKAGLDTAWAGREVDHPACANACAGWRGARYAGRC